MDYLVKANVPIYARDEKLVQPVTEEGRGHNGQPVKVTTLVAMDDIQMKSELLEHISWQKHGTRAPQCGTGQRCAPDDTGCPEMVAIQTAEGIVDHPNIAAGWLAVERARI